MKSPTPKQIKRMREHLKLSQKDAAEIIGKRERSWNYYESGTIPMDPIHWWYFKTNQGYNH